jgi:hypothetical protein
MPSGVPISRQWISVLQDGTPVVEWEAGLVQDLLSGDFIDASTCGFRHAIEDGELEVLRRAGRVESYNSWQVVIFALPEPPRRTLE